MYHNHGLITRTYHISGCTRILGLYEWTWDMIDGLAEHISKTPQEVLQMVASQFEVDVFERHGADAPLEISNRIHQWVSGILGEPVNAIPDRRLSVNP
jgi:hypothetical protein